MSTKSACAKLADASQWDEWLTSGVPADLVAHAEGCAACRDNLEAIEQLSEGLSALAASNAARVEGWDVSEAVLSRLDASPAPTSPAARRWPSWAAGLALAAAAMLAVWGTRADRIDVHAPKGATWVAAARPRALSGDTQVELPGRLEASGAGPALASSDAVQVELPMGASVRIDGPSRLSALSGSVRLESAATLFMDTHRVRLEGAGRIEVAEGDSRRGEMIFSKRAAGAAVVVVAVYAGWATLGSDEGEITGRAPVGLAAGPKGRVTSFELPDGAEDGAGADPSATIARAQAALAADVAKTEPAASRPASGAYWSEEARAVRFALEGEVIDAVSGAAVDSYVISAKADTLSEYGEQDHEKTVSDPEGKFAFEGLAPGKWRLTARAEGYAPVSQSIDLTDLGADPYIVLPMSSGARLSGMVVDHRRAPVAEAEVGLAECFGSGKGKKGCKTVVTGSDGRFVLEGLPGEEAFTVRAQHARLGSAVQPNLRKKEGETEHIVLELSGVLKVFGRVVRGKEKTPQPGVTVLAADGEVRAVTDAQGAYSLFMPLQNRPEVLVEVKNAQGLAVGFGSYPERRSSEAIKWVEAPTHVAEVNKNFLLAQDDAKVFGRITDKAGAPVAGVTIRLWNTTGWLGARRGHQTFPERTVTGPDGRYAIEGVPVKAGYTVAYEKESGERVDLGYVSVPDDRAVEANFQLGGARIRGRFVDAETGEPFSMAERHCRGNFGARRLAEGASYFVAPQCLEGGRFELADLPPGAFRLGSRLDFDDPLLKIEDRQVELAAGQILEGVEVRVRGQQARTWRLRLLDARGGFVPAPYLRLEVDNRAYTSNLNLQSDGTVQAEISNSFEQAKIDAQGFESATIDLRGRDPQTLIEVRMKRNPTDDVSR